MKTKEKLRQTNYLNQADSYTISRDSPYYVEESYFEEIMVDLGMYIAEKFAQGQETGVDELLSKIAYIYDLTIQQKMSFALFFGKHIENNEYEEYILSCMNQEN